MLKRVMIVVIALCLIIAVGTSGCTKSDQDKSKADVTEKKSKKKKKLSKHEKMLKDKAKRRSKYAKKAAPDVECKPKLTRQILQDSLKVGRQFLLNNQKPEGNFNYEYDFITKKQSRDDNAVRQSGAFWSIALLHLNQPGEDTRKAFWISYKFFRSISQGDETTGKYVVYEADPRVSLGTVALVALSIIDFIRGEKDLDEAKKKELMVALDEYLTFLKYSQMENGLFSSIYDPKTKKLKDRSSPYSDGETLLAFIKAAKYLGVTKYMDVIERGLEAGVKINIKEALKKDPDSDTTKGFYQWSTMAMWEYVDAGWKNAAKYEPVIADLGKWMVYTHQTLIRGRNTAYAMEGLLHSYKLAWDRKKMDEVKYLRCTIDKALWKLTSWQVGGPLAKETKLLVNNPTDDKGAIGGVINQKNEPGLRIDVTQHQMHVVTLALKYLYTGKDGEWPAMDSVKTAPNKHLVPVPNQQPANPQP